MKRHSVERKQYYFKILTMVMIMIGMPCSNLFGQDRPLKEFNVTVQETTISLLEDPQKEVTVWAYALEGEEPTVPGPISFF